MTAQDDSTALERARERFIALRHDQQNRWSYQKRTDMALEIVRHLEEGHFPQAPYAVNNRVLSVPLTPLIEPQGKPGVSALASSRLLHWQARPTSAESESTYAPDPAPGALL